MIRKVLATFLLIFLAGFSFSQSPKTDWVDSVYNTLTLDQRLGQLFIMPAYGSGNEQHINVLKNTIDRYTLGGIRIMDGNPESVVEINSTLKRHSSLPILSFIDLTEGLHAVINGIPTQPSLLTLAALQSDSLQLKFGQINAKNTKLLGVDVVTIDAFGLSSKDQSTIELPLSSKINWINTLNTQGVTLAVGHFPSQHDLKSKKADENEELIAFQKLTAEGLPLVRMGNITSSIDSKNIASLSRKTIDYLSTDLNYKNLIMSDRLNTIPKYKPGKTEALAIASGNHLIVSANVDISIKQIRKLIKKGGITLDQIENAAKKVLALKHATLSNQIPLDRNNISRKMQSTTDQKVINAVYQESLTTIDANEALPIKQLDTKTFASFTLGNTEKFRSTLDYYAPFTHYSASTSIEKLQKVLPLFDYVLVGIADQNVPDNITQLLNSLDNSVIVSAFSSLNSLRDLEADIVKVISYEDTHNNQQNAAEVIFGAISSNGRLPVAISNQLTEGAGVSVNPISRFGFSSPEEACMDEYYLNKIDLIIQEAIEEKATPGCQLVVARKGKIVLNRSYGYQTYDSIKSITPNSIYDLASITKVAATTQAVMFLSEHELIDLDKKVSVYLNDLNGTNKENMTIRDILTHQAGLWPYLPFWKETLTDDTFSSVYYSFNADDDYPYELSEGVYVSNITRDSVWQWVKESKIRSKEVNATFDYKYSDMGYYMLQRLVEKMVNQPMEEFLQQNFYDPLGLATMSYLPLCKFPQDVIAPTENDNYFRKSLVNGWVHDQGAAMMGGVAGHAGLFSNALDLAKLMQMLLQNGYYGNERYFMPETIEEFTSIQYASNRRGIGWDKPVVAELNSPTSPYASKKSFGHTGFTGTAVWADPEFDLVYVFLSNRIYPDATNRKLIKNNIRTRIQDLIYQSIWSHSATHGSGCN